MVITRRPLREQIRDEILTRLVRGDYPVGNRINEGQLADELGVSRTPLREALAGLAQEGVLELRPNRGFWLSPVTVDEVKETYPIIGALEALALRTCNPGDLAASVPTLLDLITEMRTAPAATAGAIDDKFHNELLKSCPNQRLLEQIKSQKTVVHRYEFAYFTDPRRIDRAATQHSQIVDAIVANDISRAATELAANWDVDTEVLAEITRAAG
ncbi:DNA-binding GntR family transcriptional regulator [Kibdelosporangium banguiense]|uniref:DNA-binding GntR family transcriptional regulator n=1 Tax=Kibdelosporangium banguiense TaxID=1365924 RepID=A0ABS4TCF4_9PSEU|nr:GntR family transcriptional regulator [Kibdelosporangium banguiense]MBP2322113.1 DNA-binding GntR family transcriptional regulator [Kibdelosporangium banguiense]